MEKDVLTTYEVAHYCRVTMTTVVNWINDGSLKAYKTKGGHRRIKKADLESFLQQHNMPNALQQRVLIVDDDPLIQIGLKKLFANNGYDVDLASSGFSAGVLDERKKPSIIILDLFMTGLDGFSVCKYIREHKDIKDTKIIVLTGYPSPENIDKAKRAGANRCIAKPVDNYTILEAVRTLLNAGR